jgi:hypothetical protein
MEQFYASDERNCKYLRSHAFKKCKLLMSEIGGVAVRKD